MQLATVWYGERTYAARVGDDHFELLGPPDVGALLAAPGGVEAARTAPATSTVPKDAVTVRGLITRPPKVLCIGQNYLRHIEETGSTVPEYPTVFAKYTRALIGDGDPIVLPSISQRVDWEVELVVVIGREVRNAAPKKQRTPSQGSPSAMTFLRATCKAVHHSGCRAKPASRRPQ